MILTIFIIRRDFSEACKKWTEISLLVKMIFFLLLIWWLIFFFLHFRNTWCCIRWNWSIIYSSQKKIVLLVEFSKLSKVRIILNAKRLENGFHHWIQYVLYIVQHYLIVMRQLVTNTLWKYLSSVFTPSLVQIFFY